MVNQEDPDVDLGGAVLEAKRRLDEKFAAQFRAKNTAQSKTLFQYFVQQIKMKH